MIIKPENIKFENTNDIIDYVTKGLPPIKKNYEKIIDKVMSPDSSQYVDNLNEVVLPEKIFGSTDNETLMHVLDRVYDNRIKTIKHTAIGLGIGACLLGLFKIFKNSK